MSTTFGFFNKLPNSDRYILNQVVTSPYESESIEDDTMVKDLSSFDAAGFDIMKYIENRHDRILSFGTDGSVQLRTDLDLVELVSGQDTDPEYGINVVNITIDGRTLVARAAEDLAIRMIALYPTGYTAP